MLTNKDRTLCKFIINELYTTEKSFHQLLKLIQTRYMHPMITASQEPSSLVKESDIPVLFRHLPEMLQLSEKIVHMINRNHQRTTSSSSMLSTLSSTSANSSFSLIRVGRMFQMLEQEMVVFLKYAVHYEAHSKLIRRACNNVVFLKIEQESLTRRDTNRMGISDYLIAPFQRVPRYCLLIKDLIKHTDRNDPQFAELDVALKLLTGLTVAMDHVQKIPR
ncbi:Dbl homology domain-containing protein [Circinella umbellata]|nr:Dbl homology domain-containing protein [Circinella umbellata]